MDTQLFSSGKVTLTETGEAEVQVSWHELHAYITTAALVAERDRLPQIAQRMHNDLKVLERLKSGDRIILR